MFFCDRGCTAYPISAEIGYAVHVKKHYSLFFARVVTQAVLVLKNTVFISSPVRFVTVYLTISSLEDAFLGDTGPVGHPRRVTIDSGINQFQSTRVPASRDAVQTIGDTGISSSRRPYS